ncbi:LysE family translocator [Chitinasiproducens palmae]|nr:LysE family translocator [Chitinasiproducens palmae]
MSSVAPLVLFVTVATLSPGGATALATASGARFGFVRSLPLILGIALALALMAAVAAVGLGELLLRVPALQTVVKALGSVYLLWLAWRVIQSGAPHRKDGAQRPATMLNGLVLLALNPKSWAMTVSAAATFALLASSPQRLGLLLATVFGLAACVSLSLWCALGVVLAKWLRTDRQWRAFNIAMGLLLAGSIALTWT